MKPKDGKRSEKRISERTQDRTTQQRSKCLANSKEERRAEKSGRRKKFRREVKIRLESSNLLSRSRESTLQQGLSNPELPDPRQEGDCWASVADDKPKTSGEGIGRTKRYLINRRLLSREDGKVFVCLTRGGCVLPLIDLSGSATSHGDSPGNSEIPVEYGVCQKLLSVFTGKNLS